MVFECGQQVCLLIGSTFLECWGQIHRRVTGKDQQERKCGLSSGFGRRGQLIHHPPTQFFFFPFIVPSSSGGVHLAVMQNERRPTGKPTGCPHEHGQAGQAAVAPEHDGYGTWVTAVEYFSAPIHSKTRIRKPCSQFSSRLRSAIGCSRGQPVCVIPHGCQLRVDGTDFVRNAP